MAFPYQTSLSNKANQVYQLLNRKAGNYGSARHVYDSPTFVLNHAKAHPFSVKRLDLLSVLFLNHQQIIVKGLEPRYLLLSCVFNTVLPLAWLLLSLLRGNNFLQTLD